MDTMKMIADINSTIKTLESEKKDLLKRVGVLEDRMTAFRMAVESLELTVQDQKLEAKSEPAPKAIAEEKKQPVRADAKIIEFNGEAHTIAEWAKRIGIVPKSLRDRLDAGWPLEKALTTPPQPSVKRAMTLEYNGIKKTVAEWAKQFGMTPATLHNRLYRGLSVEEALLTPLDTRGRGNTRGKKQQIRGKIFMYDAHGGVIRQYTNIADASSDLKISKEVVEKIIRNVSIKDQLASRNYYLAIAS